ncbi:MAG: PTS sugar transporter subunit IIA [Erysipelotrichaceae bacterium]|jgi:fructoselysine and glucoselysine-specific PTS system IIA component
MKKIIIATHGYMAKGIKSSLEILFGNVENVIDINGFTSECENPEKVLNELLKEYEDNEIVIMTDIYFGSINQLFIREKMKRNLMVISGINLPLVLEILTSIDRINNEEDLKRVAEVAKDSIKVVEKLDIHIDEDDEL